MKNKKLKAMIKELYSKNTVPGLESSYHLMSLLRRFLLMISMMNMINLSLINLVKLNHQ